MNVSVYLNDVDISNYVLNYTRDKYICNGIGKVTVSLARNIGNTMVPYDVVKIFEDGTNKGTFFVGAIDEVVPEGIINLECQDASKKLSDYFIYELWVAPTGTMASEVIAKYLTEAGVSYNFITTEGDSEIGEGTSFGYDFATNIVTSMCQQCGWYFKFDSDNVCQIGSMSLGDGSLSINDDNIVAISRAEDDEMARNVVKVWGGFDENMVQYLNSVTETGDWQRSVADDRAIVLANPWIMDDSLASTLAAQLLEEYNRTTVIYEITLSGTYAVDVGDMLTFNSTHGSGQEVVTTVAVNMEEGGLTTVLSVGQRCPRQYAYFGSIIHNIERDYIIPFYANPLTSYNLFESLGSNVVKVPLGDDSIQDVDFIWGVSEQNVFWMGYYSQQSIHRYNHVSNVTKTITLTGVEMNGYITYVPIEPSRGVVVLDEYVGGVKTGRVVIYNLNWDLLSFELLNAYEYPLSSEYYIDTPWSGNLALAVAKYGDSNRIIVPFERGISGDWFVDFLIYTEDTNTFSLAEGERIIGDDYWSLMYTEVTGFSKHYADLGNGYVGWLLPDYFIGIINTNNGTVNIVKFESALGTYDLWEAYASIAPYFPGNSFVVQLPYDEAGTYNLRILNVSLAGTVTVMDTFPEVGAYDRFSSGLSYSKTKVVSYRYTAENTLNEYGATEWAFYDVFQSREMFRIPVNNNLYATPYGGYNYAVSPAMSEPGEKIIVLKAITDYDVQYANPITKETIFTQNDTLATGRENGWTWDGWNTTSPTTSWVEDVVNGSKGLTYDGIKFEWDSGTFPDESYITGDLVWSETILATDGAFRNISTILEDGERYMATSEGTMITDNRTLPYVYGTHFDMKYPNGSNYGKEGHDIATTPLNYGDSVDTDYVKHRRPAADGDHLEVFFFNRDPYTEIAQGDNYYTGDNSGSLTVKVYEALLPKLEVGLKVPVDGYSNDDTYWNSLIVEYLLLNSTSVDSMFLRLVFTDGSYEESTTVTTTYSSTTHPLYNINHKRIRLDLSAASHGKEFSHVVVGRYINSTARTEFTSSIIITNVEVSNLNLTSTVSSYNSVGYETTLLNIEGEDPDSFSLGEIRSFRLLNATLNISLATGWFIGRR